MLVSELAVEVLRAVTFAPVRCSVAVIYQRNWW